ncbi:hypothetical protein [Bordetella hinzii]|uniref:hypothetical protein n=1 Tax=Bordetella hinzii TaxID=103855 RepID=UPI0011500B39|nr:hypothetical protein [Bordetella hinzii]
MTTNHTFGPWRKAAGIVSNPRVIVEDESGLTVCALSLRGALGDINRMNARADLISAAPELLEACMAMIEWDDREQDHAVDFNARMELCRAAFDKARAAISKAKGEQQ